MALVTKDKSTEAITNAFEQSSPSTGQLKQSFSLLEKSQLSAVSGLAGSLSTKAGKINGDVTTALRNINNTYQSSLQVGTALAGKLERAGLTETNSASTIANSVEALVYKKKSMHQGFSEPVTELANIKVRLPSKKNLQPTERMKRRRERLVGKEDLNYNGEYFPTDLQEKSQTHMQLMFLDYIRNDPFSAGSITPGEKIYLPLPDNFSETFGVRLDGQDVGHALGQFSEFMNKSGGADQLRAGNFGDATITALKGVMETDKGALGDFAFREVMDQASEMDPVLGGLLGSGAGKIPNPHPTVFFKGLDLRTFEWTWKLVPRNERDTDAINKIIKMMKTNILPERVDNWLKYPSLVLPQLVGGKLSESVTFKKCMCQTLTVNYTGEGGSAYFKDGQPVSIILSMNLTEVENFVSNDV